MQLHSTRNPNLKSDLRNAVIQGLAPDGGLYIPDKIPQLPETFFENINNLSFQEIAFQVSRTLLQGAIADEDLQKIITEVLNFKAPIVHIHDNISTLELFHGPTLAFKDFGARFMARLARHFLDPGQEITVLAATSGDTGSAVAHGFLGVSGVKVVLLYPSGKVSKIQEQQLTTIGQNVTVLEVDGVFDDCQKMVKQAFVDPELNQKLNLTSANSINIARLIPQTFYYFHAYAQILNQGIKKAPIFSVPSGNFGNLTAGLIAEKMGLPVTKFLAATNINDAFPKYLATGNYQPSPSKHTISNAMDVGSPSNFERMQELFEGDRAKMQEKIWSKSFTDKETEEILRSVYQNHHYTMDPHGAVAYLGIKHYLEENPEAKETPAIFLETAHPSKFSDVVEPIIQEKVPIPERLKNCLNKPKQSIKISNNFEDFKLMLR